MALATLFPALPTAAEPAPFAGRVDINGLPETSLVTAGVTWSPTFEWMFYLLLPLAAQSLGLRTSRWALGIALCTPLLLLIWPPWLQHAKPFVGGAAAACLVRMPVFRRWACTHWASGLMVVFLIRALFHPSGGFSDRVPLACCSCCCVTSPIAGLNFQSWDAAQSALRCRQKRRQRPSRLHEGVPDPGTRMSERPAGRLTPSAPPCPAPPSTLQSSPA